MMREVFLQGALLQASLIFALGAQNLFIIESGIQRRYPFIVSFVCFICDLIIILFGVAGAASLFTTIPHIKICVGILGVIFLFQYGMDKILIYDKFDLADAPKIYSLKRVIFKAISFSVINPHAYLDGVVLIGGFASNFVELNTRIIFGLGAASFSGLWFVLLSLTAGLLRSLLENATSMRKLMSIAGGVLIYMSGKLLVDVYDWVEELHPDLSKSHLLTSIDLFRAHGLF